MFKTVLRIAALASVELVRPGTYQQLAHLIETPAAAATPVTDRLSVTTIGKGPDVILIPGLASSAHVWDATVDHLKATHRVHVVQVAGFAGTAPGANASGPVVAPVVEAIHAYILANKLQGAALVGHSLGGLIAMEIGIQHPGDARKIMIVDSLPFLGMIAMGPQATVAAIQPMATGMRDRMLATSQEQYAAAEPRQMAALVKSHNAEADAAIAAASASDHNVVAQAVYDDFTTDLRPDLGKITVPVTTLYPYDASTGASQAMFDSLYTGAFAGLKGAKVKRIDGSYHFIMIDQPQVFLSEVDGFLKN